MAQFYWPGIWGTCSGCASNPTQCQLVNQPAVLRVLWCPLLLIKVPFEDIDIDLTEPVPRSAQGFHFLLVLMDYAMWYPEAALLCPISTEYDAGAFSCHLLSKYSKEIVASFMYGTLQELYEFMGIARPSKDFLPLRYCSARSHCLIWAEGRKLGNLTMK